MIVWDEITMCDKKIFEALDITLKDIRNDKRPMGGLILVMSGDFR